MQWRTEKRFSDVRAALDSISCSPHALPACCCAHTFVGAMAWQFRQFRDTLIKAGAGPLGRVEFPRKTISASRSSSARTDNKRVDKLQNWLNLVISSYATEPTLGPHITNFLDEHGADTLRMSIGTIQTNMAAFEPQPKQLVGNWRATGTNNFKVGGADPNAAFEEELFYLKLEADGETLTGGDNNQQNSAYKIENVELFKDQDGFVILQFVQVYDDGTRTGWYSVVDQAHINLTNGTWMAQSGRQQGKQVGSFIAQKILEDATPGRYRVLSPDGVLARGGAEKDSVAITKLDEGEEIEVTRVYRRDDGVMRLCFSKAGLEISGANAFTDATQELWISERHSENSCLLVEQIDDTEMDSYDVVVVAEGLLEQEVALQVRGAQSLTDFTDQITAAVPALAGATDLLFMYFEQDFEEFVLLSDSPLDELPSDLRIKVDGTAAPREPEPSEPEPSEPEPSESTFHLVFIESVNSTPIKVTVGIPTTVEKLEAKLRASELVVSKKVDMPLGPVTIHPVTAGENGSEKLVGPPIDPSEQISGGKQQFCVKAVVETGVPPVEPLPERTPPISLKVCLLGKKGLMSNTENRRLEVTVSSLEELREQVVDYVDTQENPGIQAADIKVCKVSAGVGGEVWRVCFARSTFAHIGPHVCGCDS
jgi:hypothetical protein